MIGLALNMVIGANKFNWNGKEGSQELSSLGIVTVPRVLTVVGKSRNVDFRLYKTDMDAGGEDTYGWHFRSDEGFEILLIND